MPNVWAIRTGLWSTGSTWNTGTVPTSADDVFISGSGLTVTIDQDVNVRSLNNRATGSIAAGGSFSITTSRTITGSVVLGSTGQANGLDISGTGLTINISGSINGGTGANSSAIRLVNATSTTVNINGNITTSGSAGSNAYGVFLGGLSNIVNITGSITGGSLAGTNNSWTVYVNGINPILNISGSVTAGIPSPGSAIVLGSSAANANISIIGNITSAGGAGLVNQTNALPYTVSIIGNIITPAGAGNSAITLGTTGLSTINITGSITSLSSAVSGIALSANNLILNISGSVAGGNANAIYGISLTGNFNTVNISGSVTGGTVAANAAGITNTSNSTINVSGTATGTIAPAISNTSTGQVIVGTAIASTSSAAISNTGGTPTIYEAATFATNGVIPISGPARLRQGNNNFISCSLDTGGYKTLINVNNISNGLPAASDVRRGTTYNFGDGVGTMAVPSASYVDSGVAVDNTSGTAVYTTASLATTVWNTNVAALTGSNSVGERLRNISTVSSTGDQLVALL